MIHVRMRISLYIMHTCICLPTNYILHNKGKGLTRRLSVYFHVRTFNMHVIQLTEI